MTSPIDVAKLRRIADGLAALDAEPDPLRAWGLDARRAR